MAKHHSDLIMCRKQPGIGIGRLCEKCDGKCVVCDSYVRPKTKVRVCDECNYGSYQGRCVICGSPGVSDAYYCTECTQTEKDVRRRRRARAFRGAPYVASVALVSPSHLRLSRPLHLNPLPSLSLSLSLSSLSLSLRTRTHAHWHYVQRDGCPKIVNLGSAKTDLFYERKKFGFKQR